MDKPMQFKRGKVTIEAMRFGGLSNGTELRRWAEKNGAQVKYTVDYGMFQIITDKATIDVLAGEWLVKDADGTFYTATPQLFAKGYKVVT
jgi:hypothetical protein